MNEQELQILVQLVDAMSDAEKKLEFYYRKKDIENFKKAKQILLEFQEKISQMLVKTKGAK